MNYVIITAAGKGTRANLGVPKQFYNVDGQPLLFYTIDVFQKSPLIDKILITLDHEHLTKENISLFKKNFSKLEYFVLGGETNQDSIFNALDYLNNFAKDDDIILIHDGVRCLVNNEIIEDNIATTKRCGNAITVVSCNEALLYTDNCESSNKFLNRDQIVKTQTPHSASFGYIKKIQKFIREKNITNSVALCTMIIEYGDKVFFSKGNNSNFKITQPEDIELFKAYLNSSKKD